MKKLLFIFALLSVTTIAISQVKVTGGKIMSIGTDVLIPYVKLQVHNGNNSFTFSLRDVDADINLGAKHSIDNVATICFWHPDAKWNKVKFKGYSLGSDSIFKTSISQIENATRILRQINTYSYFFKADDVETRKRDYGVLAQEIEDILPELVDIAKGDKFVNYNAFIAFLIKGFNEQQTLIENLQSEAKTLQKVAIEHEKNIIELQDLLFKFQEIVKECCENSNPKGGQNSSSAEVTQQLQDKAVLYQNTPNPFTSNTEIVCYLPEIKERSVLNIYNLNGIELKSYKITQTGFNSIVVNGSELPAGMYLYTLIVDNEIIDTKRMILTK